MRVDFRDLHLPSVEHDVRVLPIADRPTPRSRRGIPAFAAITVAAILAGRPAQRGDPAGLERHDEFRRGLVFPHRVGSLERQQSQVRPARDRRLRRRCQRRGKPDEGAAGHRGHDRGDHLGQRAVLAAADSMVRTIPHRGIRGHRNAAQCDAGRPTTLAHSWHRRPSARTAGLSGRPGDGGVRDDRASAENIIRASPHRRRRIRCSP